MAIIDTCIGYNSLYVTSKAQISNGKDLPDGKRLWSWLILFDDGMIVTLVKCLPTSYADIEYKVPLFLYKKTLIPDQQDRYQKTKSEPC